MRAGAQRHLVVLSLAVCSVAHVVVQGSDACPQVDVQSLLASTANVVGVQPRATMLLVLDGSGSTNMELFAAARIIGDAKKHSEGVDGYIVADCTSQRIGVAFRDFIVAMPCGVERIRTLMDSVDALSERDEFTVKLVQVLRSLDAWRASRECAVWGSESSRAAFFWLLLAACYYALKSCYIHLISRDIKI